MLNTKEDQLLSCLYRHPNFMWPSRQEIENQCYKMGLFSSVCNKLILKSVLLWHTNKQVTQYLSFPLDNLKYGILFSVFQKNLKFSHLKITLNKHMNLQLNNNEVAVSVNTSSLQNIPTEKNKMVAHHFQDNNQTLASQENRENTARPRILCVSLLQFLAACPQSA